MFRLTRRFLRAEKYIEIIYKSFIEKKKAKIYIWRESADSGLSDE